MKSITSPLNPRELTENRQDAIFSLEKRKLAMKNKLGKPVRTEKEILNELFAAYLYRLQEYFLQSNERERERMMHRVKQLVEKPQRTNDFDCVGARQTRDGLGLTRKALGSQLNDVSDITIYKYETGVLVPSTKNSTGKKYLDWLKKNKKKNKK